MHNVLKRSNWLIPAVLAFAVVAIIGGHSFVKANPLDIGLSNSTATTTVAYLTPGTATTTYTYDLWNGGSAEQVASDNTFLLVQDTSSTSASVLTWDYQFSQNGIDWYDDNTSFLATTSAASTVTVGQTYVLSGNAVASTTRKAVSLPAVPTRYVRAVFSNTGSPAGVWATFVSQKQEPS